MIRVANQTIQVSQAAGVVVCTLTPISIGSTVSGGLTTADCVAPHRSGALADIYSFAGTQGRATTIEMAANFDSYLILVGPNGSVVATDDDSLGNANARITVTLPSTGTYTIEATSFSTSGSVTGNYTLTLR